MNIARFVSTGAFTLLFAVPSFSTGERDSISPESINQPSKKELAGLEYMREEEKLARDVYIFLYEMYGLRIFDNISSSEQRHMDILLNLLEKYDVTDPALEEMGKFSNQTLQKLYDDLIELGSKSEVSALTVGATIEDVDIKDLNGFIKKTKNEELINAYQLLNCGSGNHMRAFVRQLDNRDVEYAPQYLSQKKFDQVIQGEHEKCGQVYGNHKAGCR